MSIRIGGFVLPEYKPISQYYPPHAYCKPYFKPVTPIRKVEQVSKPKDVKKALQKLHSVASEVERLVNEQPKSEIDISMVSTDELIKRAKLVEWHASPKWGNVYAMELQYAEFSDDIYTSELLRRLTKSNKA